MKMMKITKYIKTKLMLYLCQLLKYFTITKKYDFLMNFIYETIKKMGEFIVGLIRNSKLNQKSIIKIK